MRKNTNMNRVRQPLTPNPLEYCEKPEPGVLNHLSIFDSITLLTEDNYLSLTGDLRSDYPLLDRGEKLDKAIKILNESLCEESPDSVLLSTTRGSVLLQHSRTIEHETQIAEAILHMGVLMKKYANALFEEINLLPDEDDTEAHDAACEEFALPLEDDDMDVHDDALYEAPNSPSEDDDTDDNTLYKKFKHLYTHADLTMADDTWLFRSPYRKPPSSHFRALFNERLSHIEQDEDTSACGDAPFHMQDSESVSPAMTVDEEELPHDTPMFFYEDRPQLSQKVLLSLTVNPRATRLVIPEGVTSLAAKALHACKNITHLTLPSTIIEISAYDFALMPKLEHIDIAGHKRFESKDGVLYRRDSARELTLVHYGQGRTDSSFCIPAGVTSIDSRAFAYNHHLCKLYVPESVWDVGDFAFSFCDHLDHIRFDNMNELYIRNDAFFACKHLNSILFSCCKLHIETRAFAGCTSLAQINLPGLRTIEDLAFLGCSSLMLINLPDTLKEAGHNLFQGCCDNLRIHCGDKAAELIPENKHLIFPISSTAL